MFFFQREAVKSFTRTRITYLFVSRSSFLNAPLRIKCWCWTSLSAVIYIDCVHFWSQLCVVILYENMNNENLTSIGFDITFQLLSIANICFEYLIDSNTMETDQYRFWLKRQSCAVITWTICRSRPNLLRYDMRYMTAWFIALRYEVYDGVMYCVTIRSIWRRKLLRYDMRYMTA